MKKLLIAAVIIASIGAFAKGNMLVNGDFKQGNKNWYVSKNDASLFLFIPADKPAGPCLKVVGAEKPKQYARIYNQIKLPKDVTLKPGDEVVVKVKLKCEKLSGKFQVMFRQADAKGKSLNYAGMTLRKRYKCNWKEFTSKAKIKKNTDRIYIYIISTYLSPKDTIYIKNISVEKAK